jgi:Domain of unknown function (DUF6456)
MSIVSQSIENEIVSAISSAASSAAFFWRKGRWYMSPVKSGRTRLLSQGLGRTLARLKAEGKLSEGPPGCFRLRAGAATPVMDDFESPLLRLAAAKNADGTPYLDDALVRAGERMRRDFEASGLSQRVTVVYGDSVGSGGRHWQSSDNATARLTDAALAARQLLHAAMDAVGPELSGILFDICCMASGLEQAELRLDLPRRAGKAVLLLALTRLARHYGLKAHMKHAGPSSIGHWALADFKPLILSPQLAPHQP